MPRPGMKTTDDSGQTVQRVKVAMTGLALVLLLIGVASVIFSSASSDTPADLADTVQSDLVANLSLTNDAQAAATAPSEPLAELGVAPSTTTVPSNTIAPVRDRSAAPR
ncbi:hypothetical protein DFR49_1637 [Hephaestia caeni]|uniref:Uncharacterized protein n=1 Tax=Hephaestia caeni TaxID=645617 RepID=A0A397PDG2_9SPHN|nr:hypothetical protein [Hephaestia caeni]RIA47072.1 hypothetical protein DFR49_1637 [Hephaestia caeni]